MRNRILKNIIRFMVVFICVLTLLPVHANAAVYRDLDLSCWMSSMPDDTLISRINMPGSHDAGMYNPNCNNFFARRTYATTQVCRISEQLDKGCRFFDIRLGAYSMEPYEKDYNYLCVNHNGYEARYEKDGDGRFLRFKDVISEVDSFLAINDRETVVLFLQAEGFTSGPKDKAKKMILENIKPAFDKDRKVRGKWDRFDFYPSGSDVPSLGKVRGKCIIICDEESPKARTKYEDNCGVSKERKEQFLKKMMTYVEHFYGWYAFSNVRGDKFEKDPYDNDYGSTSGEPRIKLCYMSTNEAPNVINGDSPKDAADYLFDKFKNDSTWKQEIRYGWIPMDFVGRDDSLPIIYNIICSNIGTTYYTVQLKDMALHGYTPDMIIIVGTDSHGRTIEIDKNDYEKYGVSFSTIGDDIILKAKALPLYADDNSKYTYSVILNAYGYDREKEYQDKEDKYIFIDGKWSARRQVEKIKISKDTTEMPIEIQWIYEDDTAFSEPSNVKEFFEKCDELVLRGTTKTDKDTEVRIDGKKLILNPALMREFEKVSGEEHCYLTEVDGLEKESRVTGGKYEYDIKDVIFSSQSAKDDLRYVWSVKENDEGVLRLIIDVRSDSDTVEVIGTATISDGNDFCGKRDAAFDSIFDSTPDGKEITIRKTSLDGNIKDEKVIVETIEKKNNNIVFSGTTTKYDENKDYYSKLVYIMPDVIGAGHYEKINDEDNEAVYELVAPTDVTVIWNLGDTDEIPEPFRTEGITVKLLPEDEGRSEEVFSVSSNSIGSGSKYITWKSEAKTLALFDNNSTDFMYKVSGDSVDYIRSKLEEAGVKYSVSVDAYTGADSYGYPTRHIVVFCDSINTEKVGISGTVRWNDGLLSKEHNTKDAISLKRKVEGSADTEDISDKLNWDAETERHFTATLPKAEDSKPIAYTVNVKDVPGYSKVRTHEVDYDYTYTKLISVSVNGIPDDVKDCKITLLRDGVKLSNKEVNHRFDNLLIADENNNPYLYTVDIKDIGDYSVDYTKISTDEEGNVSIEATFYKGVKEIEIPVRLDIQGSITGEEFEVVFGCVTDKQMIRESVKLNKENGFKARFKVPASELTDTEWTYEFWVIQFDNCRPGIEYDLHYSKIEAKVAYGSSGKMIFLKWKDPIEEIAQESIFVNKVDIIPATLSIDGLKHSVSDLNKQGVPKSDFVYKLFTTNDDKVESILALSTVSENGDGKAKDIKFDLKENPVEFYETGKYTLYVSAVDMGENGYVYDTTPYEIIATVEENPWGHNSLIVTDVKYDSRLKNKTINHVFSEVKYCIPIRNEIEGTSETDKEFKFTVKDVFDESNKKEAKVTGASIGQFPAFTYSEPGEYYYIVSEVCDYSDSDWIYDEKQYSYKVNVTRGKDGRLKADGEDYIPTFINRYTKKTIPVLVTWIDEKDEKGEKPLRPDKLEFTLKKDGVAIGGTRNIIGEKTEDKWYYETELLPLIKRVGADDEEIEYSIDVSMPEVTDKYAIQCKGSAGSGFNIICIEKALYKTEDISIKIEWDDDDNKLGVRPEGLQIGLAASPDYWHIDPVLVNSDTAWKATFSELPVYLLDENDRKIEVEYAPVFGSDEEGNYEVNLVKDEATGEYTLKFLLKGSLMLWTEPVNDVTYTGKQIKPDVNVHMGRKLINKGADYSLKYSNNVNAGKAKIRVVGKGNYSGEDVTYFNIKQKNVSDDDVTVSIADKKHTGNTLVSKPVVKYGDITLKENRDYTITYSGNQVEKGIVQVLITGQGNYTGERTVTYRIYDKDYDFSKVYVDKIEDQEYTGELIAISSNSIKVYTDSSKSKQLVLGDDFEISYSRNLNVGTATAIIRGCGNYSSYGGVKTVKFKIVKKSLADANIIITGNRTYTGKQVKPSVIVKMDNRVIDPIYYSVKYVNNKDVASVQKGKVPSVVINGKGNYKGSASAKFDIIEKWLANTDVSVTIPNIKDKGKPITENDIKPSVKYGELKLTKDRDYTVGFRDEGTKSLQYVTLKLKGNYRGEIISPVRVYSSSRRISLSENTIINVSDCKHTGRALKPKLSVVDTTSGKAVSAKYYNVEYKNNVNISDTLPTVTVSGKGDYCDYIVGNFRIYQNDITKVFVERIPSQEYTGSQVRPVSEAINVFTDKHKTIKLNEGTDYVLEYGTNIKKGSGTVVLKGIGSYGGSKTVKFLILSKRVIWIW